MCLHLLVVLSFLKYLFISTFLFCIGICMNNFTATFHLLYPLLIFNILIASSLLLIYFIIFNYTSFCEYSALPFFKTCWLIKYYTATQCVDFRNFLKINIYFVELWWLCERLSSPAKYNAIYAFWSTCKSFPIFVFHILIAVTKRNIIFIYCCYCSISFLPSYIMTITIPGWKKK